MNSFQLIGLSFLPKFWEFARFYLARANPQFNFLISHYDRQYVTKAKPDDLGNTN